MKYLSKAAAVAAITIAFSTALMQNAYASDDAKPKQSASVPSAVNAFNTRNVEINKFKTNDSVPALLLKRSNLELSITVPQMLSNPAWSTELSKKSRKLNKSNTQDSGPVAQIKKANLVNLNRLFFNMM